MRDPARLSDADVAALIDYNAKPVLPRRPLHDAVYSHDPVAPSDVQSLAAEIIAYRALRERAKEFMASCPSYVDVTVNGESFKTLLRDFLAVTGEP